MDEYAPVELLLTLVALGSTPPVMVMVAQLTTTPDDVVTVPLMCPLVASLRFAVAAVPLKMVTEAEFGNHPDNDAFTVYVPAGMPLKV